mgnify:CR=1 FL=1
MTEQKHRHHRVFFKWWIRISVLTLIVCLFPVSYRSTRLLEAILIPSLFVSGSWLFFKKGLSIIATTALSLFFLLIIISKEKKINPKRLQEAYIEELKTYKGTYYIWGGENKLGIDCSGLARKALINALWKNGLNEPQGFYKAFYLWWNDSTAKSMAAEWKGLTLKVSAKDQTINTLDYTAIRAGDLAITDDGVHVMIYLGAKEWIEADPGVKEVIQIGAPNKDFAWFNYNVTICRWSILNSRN